MSLILYGASLSPFVRKVRVLLTEKNLEYEQVPIDPFNKPENYSDISPCGRIPALKHDDNILADSSVICSYLEQLHQDPALYPSDPYLRARALWFEKYADYEIAPLATFTVFRNRVVMRLIGKNGDEDKVDKALTTGLPPLFDYLEKEIGDNEFIVGEHFSIADIAITSQFLNLKHGGESIDANRWPKMSSYVEQNAQRESFKNCWDQEKGFLDKVFGR